MALYNVGPEKLAEVIFLFVEPPVKYRISA